MVRGHVKERDSVVDFVNNQQLQLHSNEPTKPRLQTKGIPQRGKRCQFSGRHTRMSASFVLLRRQSATNARNEGTSMSCQSGQTSGQKGNVNALEADKLFFGEINHSSAEYW